LVNGGFRLSQQGPIESWRYSCSGGSGGETKSSDGTPRINAGKALSEEMTAEVRHLKTISVYFFLVRFTKDCKFYSISIPSLWIDENGNVFFVTLWERQIVIMTNGNLGAEISTLCAYMDTIANADEQTRVRDLHLKLFQVEVEGHEN